MLLGTLVCLGWTQYNTQQEFRKLHDEIECIKDSNFEIQRSVDTIDRRIDSLDAMHPWQKVRPRRTSKVCAGTLFGFILYTPVDTTMKSEFRLALQEYTGPAVKINSLKRHGTRSAHCKGLAVDLEFSPQLIDYLVSEEGQVWLKNHSLMFYIEGKPGSRKVRSYQRDVYAEYVFFNPEATGDHIHIQKT